MAKSIGDSTIGTGKENKLIQKVFVLWKIFLVAHKRGSTKKFTYAAFSAIML